MTMMKTLALVSGSVLVLAAQALAAESSLSLPSGSGAATNVSTATATPTEAATPLLDRFSAGYLGVYHGPSVSDLTSYYTLDNNGFKNRKNAAYIDSTSDLDYLFTKSIGLGAYVPFFIVPAPGQHFVIGDVGAQLFNRKTVDSGGLRVFTNAIVQAPTSDASKARKETVALKFTPSVAYQFPRSSFKVGSYTEEKAYLGVNAGKTFKLWAMPYVNYALSDSFSLNLAYEMEADHFYGKPDLDFTSYQTDLQPGFVWKITRQVLVNPYVQIFTGNNIAADNIAVGAVLNARIL